jgi:hypothetical protein
MRDKDVLLKCGTGTPSHPNLGPVRSGLALTESQVTIMETLNHRQCQISMYLKKKFRNGMNTLLLTNTDPAAAIKCL